MPDPRYNTPNVCANELRKQLGKVEQDLGQVVHGLNELYIYQGVENRLARDVLATARQLLGVVRQRISPE